MLTDNRENIRSLALRKLICARIENRGSSEVRIFQVPKIDFKAKDYFELINWRRVRRFEPPVLMNVPFKEIEAMVKMYGEEKRYGFILNRIQSRSHIKHYNTKKDYNL
ncbi:hypothetical protein AVEN_143644-1 [Araneus ventricosus]|uniref:Uncharacterized protein n=1 Tax=Araneus ventricosus TaxID=182803 RepID=A0A4Y2AQP3_ARAVE|nr:hypothetical protein AVEN_143644-1 [Araneus ventricosus]